MQTSPEIAELAAALVKANEDFPAVVKDASNPHFGSRYASLGAIVDAVRPVLAQHGITIVQSGGQADDAGAEVVTRLLHRSGQWIETVVRMPLGKSNAQGAGSALTYGRRYGLSAALNIVADDDDDGNAASATKTDARPERKPTPPTPSAGASFAMPFGKSKGTPLSALETDGLKGALEWAESKDKFTEFQVAARAELARRDPVYAGMHEPPPALDDEDAPW